MALTGPKLHLRVALGCLSMLIIPVLFAFGPRFLKKHDVAATAASKPLQSTEIFVEPHSTWWSMFQPQQPGEMIVTLEAGELEVGMNASAVGQDGFTATLDSKMRETQHVIPPGKKNEMKVPVTAQGKYAAFVINETDARAKARITVTIRPAP